MNVHALYRGSWARPVPALATHVAAIVAAAHFATPPRTWVFGAAFGLFALGLCGWTLFEYGLHRLAMHGPRPLWELLHQEHHQLRQMEEKEHYLLHPVVGVPAFGLVVWLGTHVVPAPAMLGWWTGYVFYEAFHFMQHRPALTAWAVRVPYLRHTVGAHTAHHLRKVTRNYGVTTLFWDRVFGTYLPPLEAERRGARALHAPTLQKAD